MSVTSTVDVVQCVMYANGFGVDRDYAEAARLYRLAAEQRSGAGESLGDLIRSECAVLAFPLGDSLTAGIETQAMGGGLGDPRADGRALCGGRNVDRIGQVGGK